MSEPAGTDLSSTDTGPAGSRAAGNAVDTGSAAPGRPSPSPVGAEALAERFVTLADHDFAGYCPAYERIARAMADDPRSLALLLDAAPVGRTPVLALAAVHDLVLDGASPALAEAYGGGSAADPWPLFRDLLHERAPEVLRRMRTRGIQTNEVGRSAALLPALGVVRASALAAGDRRPLALVEVGPSAGLNLLLDRFGVTYRRDAATVARVGDPSSAVQLTCELRGPADPPLADLPVPIASRTGIDLDPVDVTDASARRWLSACVWPGVPDRPERLAAAMELARLDPPTLVAGDAVHDLAPLVAALPDEVLPVVVATWALAYLGRDGRAALLESLDEVGGRRPLALVTAEEAHVTPWVPPVPAPVAECGAADGSGTATVLGLRSWRGAEASDEVLALCHPHVRWMAWVPGAGEAGA